MSSTARKERSSPRTPSSRTPSSRTPSSRTPSSRTPSSRTPARRATMRLQRHQIDAVEHAVARCLDQRFTLLYHQMGTGKTLTGLSIAMSVPSVGRALIFVPDEVLQPWESLMADLRVREQRSHEALRLIPFSRIDDPDSPLTDINAKDTVVVDEAHNIISELLSTRPKWNALRFSNALRSAGKIVFMTGTPVTDMYRGVMDVALLVNIGSGKEIVPFDKGSFYSKFFKVDKSFRSTLLTRIYPTLANSSIGKTGLAMLVAMSGNMVRSFGEATIVSSGVIKLAGNPQMRMIESKYSGLERSWAKWLNNTLDTWLPKTYFVTNFINVLLRRNYGVMRANATGEAATKSMRLPFMQDVERRFGNIVFDYAFYKTTTMLTKPIHKLSYEIAGTEWRHRRQRDELLRLDTEHLGTYLRDIILPFRINDQDPNYPRVITQYHEVPYTAKQYATLYKLADGVMDDQMAAHFLGSPDEMLENIKFLSSMPYEDFVREGVSIGSMTIDGEVAPKVAAICDMMDEATVVWSSLERDMKEFARTLARLKPRLRVVRLRKSNASATTTSHLAAFERGDVDVLLLDPDMYQGISIKGARHMHVLEPSSDVLKVEQAVARVRRFRSHAHLPEEERDVTVHEWVCVRNEDDKVREKAAKEYLRMYKPHLHHSLLDIAPDKWEFGEWGVTPDETIHTFMSTNTRDLQDLASHLTKIGTTCSAAPLQCCAWQPDADDYGACLERPLPPCRGDGGKNPIRGGRSSSKTPRVMRGRRGGVKTPEIYI